MSDLPTEAILRVERVDCRIERYEWKFAREEAARIDAHWADLLRAKPKLYDGRVLVSHHIEIVDGVLRGACFETGYKSFLAWRDFGYPGARVFNTFAMPALRASDGAFMLGEMSAGTANAGRLYFPAGTPEPSDADADGRVDYEANLLRELFEETGLRSDEVTLVPDWTIVLAGPLVAMMKVARARETAEALQARLVRYNATLAHPELDRLVAVRGGHDIDTTRTPPFMQRYLANAWRADQAR